LTSLIFGLLLIFFILTGLPITISFLASTLIAIFFSPKIPLSVIPTLLFGSLNSFVLVAVPFFILAGKIMEHGGHSYSIFRFANSLVGWMKGGLGNVNVMASMLFGAMTGSATADAAGLGQIEIPAMTKFNYPLDYSAAITAASATLAVLIPPSMVMVVYAINAEISISQALVAGFLPGIFIGIVLMILNIFYTRKGNWGIQEKFSLKEIITSFYNAFFPMLTPIIIIGGMLTGQFTPTEASNIAVLYALVLIISQKKFSFKIIKLILLDTASCVGSVLIIVATASIVSFILSTDRVPMRFAQFLLSLSDNKIIIMLTINLLLLIVGCFFESIVAIMLIFPILLPVLKLFQVDLLHFGPVMIANLAIGMLTPPVGAVLYATSSVAKIKIHKLTRKLFPFYLALIISLLIITFVPEISLFLPRIIFR